MKLKLIFYTLVATASMTGASEANLLPENLHQFKCVHAKIKGSEFLIDAEPGKWCAITSNPSLKQGFYKITFDYKAPARTRILLFSEPENEQSYRRQYRDNGADDSWRTMNGYLCMPSDGIGIIKIAAEAKSPAAVKLRKIRMQRIPEKEVANFQLKPNEKDSLFWQIQWKFRNSGYKIGYADAQDHIDGGHAVRLTPEPGSKAAFQTWPFPVAGKKKYTLSIWLKSQTEIPAAIYADGWVSGKAHWYQVKKINISAQWNEYVMEFTTPEADAYGGMLSVKIEPGAVCEFLDVKDIVLKVIE